MRAVGVDRVGRRNEAGYSPERFENMSSTPPQADVLNAPPAPSRDGEPASDDRAPDAPHADVSDQNGDTRATASAAGDERAPTDADQVRETEGAKTPVVAASAAGAGESAPGTDESAHGDADSDGDGDGDAGDGDADGDDDAGDDASPDAAAASDGGDP